jgi:hypothetical protein
LYLLTPKVMNVLLVCNVVDPVPDPYVFKTPGSGSGSFHQQEKKALRKKMLKENLFFSGILSVTGEKKSGSGSASQSGSGSVSQWYESPDPDP